VHTSSADTQFAIDIIGLINSLFSGMWSIALETLPLVIGAWIAIAVIYRQREYEIIRERYLSNGFDKASASLSESIGITRNNWARALYLLKTYQKLGQNFDISELEKEFSGFNVGQLEPVANQHVAYLIDDRSVWEGFQKSMACFKSANDFLMIELPQVIRHNQNADEAKRGEIATEAEKELTKIDNKLYEIHILISYVVSIGQMFERERFQFKKLSDFASLDDVQEAKSEIKKVVDSLKQLSVMPIITPFNSRSTGAPDILVGSRTQQQDMIRAIEANNIKPVIDRTFSLDEMVDAFKYQESNRHFGKICLQF